MAEDQSREHSEQQRAQRPEQSTAGLEDSFAPESLPSYSSTLMGDPRLDGRGNQSVRVALMRQTQQTYGNRVVRQMLQRKGAGAAQAKPPSLQRSPVVIQRQNIKTVSGRYVGDLPGATANLQEDVLQVMDKLHIIWSLNNADYGVEYAKVSAAAPGSNIPATDIPLTIAAINRNKHPALHPAVAKEILGVSISATVGEGQSNKKADILLLQDALHGYWNIANDAYAAERAAVKGGGDAVKEIDIPATVSGITAAKMAYVAGTTRKGGLLAGTRLVTADEAKKVEGQLTPGVTRDPKTGASPPFKDVVKGRTYREDLIKTLDKVRAYMYPQSEAMMKRKKMPMTTLEGIGAEAKVQTDAMFGKYASGPPLKAGTNIIDRSLQPPDVADLMRYLINNQAELAPVRKAHSADHSRPAEAAIAKALITDYPNISADHRSQLEIIDQGWPAISGGGVVQIQPFEAKTPKGTRVVKWQSFQTMIHEYLHTITHPNFSNVANSLSEERASVLVEGGTSLFTDDVWKSIHPTKIQANATLRANVEGKPVPFDASVIPPISHYDQIAQARVIRSTVGDENLKAAYFLGRTELIGMPTAMPAPGLPASAGQTYKVPPTGVDTVADVAFATGATVEDIANANKLKTTDSVSPGQILTVPGLAAKP